MRRCPIFPWKTRYEHRSQAFAESRRIQIESGKLLNVYECEWCNGFHFTDPEKHE